MSDRLSDLERLSRLRRDGAISDEEFALEKARLLDAGLSSMSRTRWLWPTILGLLVVAVVIAAAVLFGRSATDGRKDATASAPSHARPTPSSATADQGVGGLLPDERLSAAVRAAFPNGATGKGEDGQRYAFDTHRLVDTNFGQILVSEGHVPDFSASDPGRLDITYLTANGDRYDVSSRFPAAVETGSMGKVAGWSVSNKFSGLPVVQAAGGATEQGITCGFTDLTELRPEGPVKLIAFQDSFSSDADGAIRGSIGDIVSGRSFVVHYTGTRTFDRRYVRVGNGYRLAGTADDLLPEC